MSKVEHIAALPDRRAHEHQLTQYVLLFVLICLICLSAVSFQGRANGSRSHTGKPDCGPLSHPVSIPGFEDDFPHTYRCVLD